MKSITALLWLLVPTLAWAQSNWQYRDIHERRENRVVYTASVPSTGGIVFKSGKGVPQTATLLLRTAPGTHGDALLSIAVTGFVCGKDGCSVWLGFDKKPLQRCPMLKLSERPMNIVFLRCFDDLIRGLRTAKTLRIEALFDGEGRRAIPFDVRGFAWKVLEQRAPAKEPGH